MNAQVERAAQAAAGTFREYSQSPPGTRAQLLREIADGIERLGDTLIACVNRETALPTARIAGERARTCMQLRLFADLAAHDAWIDERIDAADAARTPPKPQVRSRLCPIGPAAVFAASNFPLAFSVAGGDTAAALAVGCPVVVKAHPAHPDTAALVAGVIHAALSKCRLPGGVFSLLSGEGYEHGLDLVRHPLIKVGAFTGSQVAGLALWRAVQQRAEPIPFFAEMGSVNPVFIFPDALTSQADAIAAGLHASMTLGVGQFCTQPGVIFLIGDATGQEFIGKLSELVAATASGEMLSASIRDNYAAAVDQRMHAAHVRVLAHGGGTQTHGGAREAVAALLATDARTFCARPELAEEVFGPSSLLVVCDAIADFERCAQALRGQLTATLWSTGDAHAAHADLLWTLQQRVGRIVFNGFPTGVEVGTAMMHGGPFPATTDGRYTSVGTRSLARFVRPIAWQTPAQ